MKLQRKMKECGSDMRTFIAILEEQSLGADFFIHIRSPT